jgi:mRNA-degrading endonuclease RelE of RelBE toxin-antitoxin system
VSYTVRLGRRAERYLSRLDAEQQARIVRKLEELAQDPFAESKPLAAAGGRRSARVGGWRIVLSVDVDAEVVEVKTIAPRGDVYKDLWPLASFAPEPAIRY